MYFSRVHEEIYLVKFHHCHNHCRDLFKILLNQLHLKVLLLLLLLHFSNFAQPHQYLFSPNHETMSSLRSSAGKVLVHCARGISRSAALTLAYLMLREKLTLVEAVEAVRRHRNILPNIGFLNQLCHLDTSLALQRKTTQREVNELKQGE